MSLRAVTSVTEAGKRIGFILNDNKFYNNHIIKENICAVENLYLDKNGVTRVKGRKLDVIHVNQYLSEAAARNEDLNQFDLEFSSNIREYLLEDISTGHLEDKRILHLYGMSNTGKTCEVLRQVTIDPRKYKVINIDLRANGRLDLGEFGRNPVEWISEYCETMGLIPFDNSDKTLILIDHMEWGKTRVSGSEDKQLVKSDNWERFEVTPEWIEELLKELNCKIILVSNSAWEKVDAIDKVEAIEASNVSFKKFLQIIGKESLIEYSELLFRGHLGQNPELSKLIRHYLIIGGSPLLIKMYRLGELDVEIDKFFKSTGSFEIKSQYEVMLTNEKYAIINRFNDLRHGNIFEYLCREIANLESSRNDRISYDLWLDRISRKVKPVESKDFGDSDKNIVLLNRKTNPLELYATRDELESVLNAMEQDRFIIINKDNTRTRVFRNTHSDKIRIIPQSIPVYFSNIGLSSLLLRDLTGAGDYEFTLKYLVYLIEKNHTNVVRLNREEQINPTFRKLILRGEWIEVEE